MRRLIFVSHPASETCQATLQFVRQSGIMAGRPQLPSDEFLVPTARLNVASFFAEKSINQQQTFRSEEIGNFAFQPQLCRTWFMLLNLFYGVSISDLEFVSSSFLIWCSFNLHSHLCYVCPPARSIYTYMCQHIKHYDILY